MMAIVRYLLLFIIIIPVSIVANVQLKLKDEALNIVLYVVCPTEAVNTLITIIYIFLAVRTGRHSTIEEIYRESNTIEQI